MYFSVFEYSVGFLFLFFQFESVQRKWWHPTPPPQDGDCYQQDQRAYSEPPWFKFMAVSAKEAFRRSQWPWTFTFDRQNLISSSLSQSERWFQSKREFLRCSGETVFTGIGLIMWTHNDYSHSYQQCKGISNISEKNHSKTQMVLFSFCRFYLCKWWAISDGSIVLQQKCSW